MPDPDSLDRRDEDRPASTRVALCFAVALYLGACIFFQAGWPTLWRTLVAVAVLGLLVKLLLGVVRYRILSVLLAGVVPLALWMAVWGSYSLTRDLLGGLVALGIAWLAARHLTAFREAVKSIEDPEANLDRPHRRFVRRFVLSGFVLVWIVNSGLDVLFESKTEARLAEPWVAARGRTAPYPEARVGLALSGGGYRAALFHAGVLAELDANRIPVSAVSAVSGGSIVGAFYVAGGDPHDLRDAIAGGRLNLKRDMADVHNALRLPFPGEVPFLGVRFLPWMRFGRADVQANLIDRVFLGGTTLRDLATPDRPRLQICASDLRSGAGVGLSTDGAILLAPPRPARVRTDGRIPYETESTFHPAVDPETRVASLVAASGAFPGAFDAVDLRLPASGGHPETPLQLADGGIVDNWGVGALLERYRRADAKSPWRVDVLIVSAGGRIFAAREDVPSPMQVRRAIDIIYETAGWRPLERADDAPRPPLLLLQPADAAPDSPEFRAFAEADTLADGFDPDTAEQLFELGRLQVRAILGELDARLPKQAAAVGRAGS